MTVPKLKRIKVSSAQELDRWLRKAPRTGEVLIVTCNKTSRDKAMHRDEVRLALAQRGWTAGRSYTLNGGLAGHVAKGE